METWGALLTINLQSSRSIAARIVDEIRTFTAEDAEAVHGPPTRFLCGPCSRLGISSKADTYDDFGLLRSYGTHAAAIIAEAEHKTPMTRGDLEDTTPTRDGLSLMILGTLRTHIVEDHDHRRGRFLLSRSHHRRSLDAALRRRQGICLPSGRRLPLVGRPRHRRSARPLDLRVRRPPAPTLRLS
jgi:hypothetical protein